MQRILNKKRLTDHGNTQARCLCLDIIEEGLKAADPYYHTKQLVRVENNTLIFKGSDFEASGDPKSGPARYVLEENTRVFLFAIGKGIQYSAKAIEEILGDKLTGGYVIAKHGDPVIMERIEVMLGGHPVPDQYCIEGCKRMLHIISSAHLTPSDLVITIIGNGVSSLMTLPVDGVSLSDIIRCVEILQIQHGIPTSELNHIRNHIDQLKGGQITRLLSPARMVHLLTVSPDINDSTEYTGYEALIRNNFWLHTLPDQTTTIHALEYLRTHNILSQIPPSIISVLKNNTQHPGISPEDFQAADNRVFALMPQCRDATSAAIKRAKTLGLTPYLLTRKTQCEAKDTGIFLAQMAKSTLNNNSPFHPPCALIFSGELLVTCGDSPGIGGRNQELCLAAAHTLRDQSNIALAAVDTDGTDGPGGFISSEADKAGIHTLAGALIDGFTYQASLSLGLQPHTALSTHDTSPLLWSIGDGIVATHNVSIGDLVCCVIL